ncbi:3'-5' exonuclease [Streptomyces roseolus]|uniref:3'-5' exonuclease n=1 Tax=Streptomyces roseolus TaxID=67358 RepID=UPI003795E86D
MQFVRPVDTDRLVWAVYEAAVCVGSVTAESHRGRPLWRVQGTREAHRDLDDAIRPLRRPSSWTREREQAASWARRLLADETLLAVNVETTGLENAYTVQISAVDRAGTMIINEYVHPDAPLESAAVAVHGITPDRLAQAPAFAELLPALTDVFHGRIAVAYKMDFDRGVIERELRRHHRGDAVAADA